MQTNQTPKYADFQIFCRLVSFNSELEQSEKRLFHFPLYCYGRNRYIITCAIIFGILASSCVTFKILLEQHTKQFKLETFRVLV